MHYDKAISIDSSYTAGYTNRGILYVKEKLLDLALKDFNKAIVLDSALPEAYLNRAILYTIYGGNDMMEKAIKDLNQGIKLKPKFSAAYHFLAIAYGAEGNHAEAQRDKEIEKEMAKEDGKK